ncbi:MAG: hypothetical protein OEU93_19075 [Rubrivivax sp.]|nr:hypothetical protein [Rubrivivax sp.]
MKRLFFFLLALFSMTAFAQNTATLGWTAPTTYTDGTPITEALTYQVYQGVGAGSTKAKVGTPLAGTTRTISTGLLGGRVYCWQVSTVAASGESALSNEACKTFPQAPPSAPSGLSAQ